MTQQPIDANVVLTADNSQYNQSMSASAAQTESLGKTIDTLTTKLDRLAKAAGRKLMFGAAGDVAVITAATTAYAAWEKQMSSLNVQAAVLTKTTEGQKRTFSEYANQVAGLRKEFAMTTSDAAQLTQTLSRMTDGTKSVNDLAASFAKLGNVTGESTTALAQSMLQLQKTMGTPQRDTEKLNSQLAVLSQRSNATAESILGFSQSIAPVGRLVNMTQTDIMGFSSAFIKAGQDGYQASSVFNKMLSDIAYATQTGSPALAQYANLVGMTTANFKELSGTDKYLKIFEAINRQGPQAITTLNRMGLDGMRTVRTVTAMAQQGGMADEIAAARNADSGSLDRGNTAAMDTLVHKLKEIRTELAMTAESFGANFAGPAGHFLDMMGKMASAARILVDSPLGKLAALVMGIAAPVMATAGALFMAAKGLAAFAAANALIRSSFVSGFRETAALGAASRGTAGILGERGGMTLIPPGPVGARLQTEAAEGKTSWTTRGMYMGGSNLARLSKAGIGEGPSLMSRMAGYGMYGMGGAAKFVAQLGYSTGAVEMPGVAGSGGYDNPNKRLRFMESPTFKGSMQTIKTAAGTAFTAPVMFAGGVLNKLAPGFSSSYANAFTTQALLRSGKGFIDREGAVRTYADAKEIDKRWGKIGGLYASDNHEMAQRRAVQAEQEVARASASAKALGDLEKNAMYASRGASFLGKNLANLTMMIAGTGIGAGRTIGGLASHAYGLLGGNPVLAGGIAAFATYKAYHAVQNDQNYAGIDQRGLMNPYYQAAGVAAPPKSPYSFINDKNRQVTLQQALNISDQDQSLASSSNYKLVNKDIKDFSKEEAQAWFSSQWGAMLKSPALMNNAVLDLTSLFGKKDTQGIIKNLQGSSSMDLSVFSDKAANPGRGGLHHSNFGLNYLLDKPSGDEAAKAWENFFGAANAHKDYQASVQNPRAAERDYGRTVEAGVNNYLKNNYRSWVTGENADQQFDKVIAKQIFGIDQKDLTFQGLRHPLAAQSYVSHSDNFKDYLEKSFSGQGVYAYDGGINDRARSRYDVPESYSNKQAADFIYKQLTNPGPMDTSEGPSPQQSLKRATQGVFGKGGLLGNSIVSYALNSGSEDPNAQYQAVNAITEAVRRKTGNWGQQQKMLSNWNVLTGGDAAMGSQYLNAAKMSLAQSAQWQIPFMTRPDAFSAQTAEYKGQMAANMGVGGEDARNAAKAKYQQTVVDQYNFVKQELYQQREFDVSRDRAEADYNTQRTYNQHDFTRQRNREEADYHLMRKRAEADFARQEKRSHQEFNISRKREEADYHHTVSQMIEQNAQQMLNIYQRTPVQQTSSGDWLLHNAHDQLKQMQEQSANLDKLRGMGMSDNAIQQLGLTDASNAQQLARLVADAADDPRMVQQFNDAVAKRLKAAGKLTKDSSSTSWQEFQRSHHLAVTHAQQDFERSLKIGQQDFKISMAQQDDNFQRSMHRQDNDFDRSMKRMATAYNLTMQRASDDLARSAETIDGSFEKILTKGVNGLSGHAKAMAKAVLAEFRNLKASTDPYAIDLMRSLSDIFGVKYTGPTMASSSGTPGGMHAGDGQGQKDNPNVAPHTAAQGAVLPGFTPGRDVHRFTSPTGGELHLSGGEAVMVPEWTRAVGGEKAVKEMNHRARHGFAKGGVFWPVPGHETGTYPGHDGVDINRGSGWDDFRDPIRAAAGGKVAYVGTGHGYGEAIFIRTKGGVTNIYGHTDAQYVHAGQKVAAGQLIGLVGNTGHSSAPHLHFGVSPGLTTAAALSFLAGTYSGGFGGLQNGSYGGSSLASLIKERYPAAERAAKMQAMRPLHNGDISHIINGFARAKYKQMLKHGMHSAAETWGALPNEPHQGGSNMELVRKAAYQFGWDSEWPALRQLVSHESGFSNTAQNPSSTAYGMFQFLNSTWAGVNGHKTSDPWQQSVYGMRYIKDRYGDPNRAWKFWQNHNWYGDGGIFTGPQSIGVGERGPEMVMPLSGRGAEFIADIVRRTSVGNESKQGLVQGSVPVGSNNSYNYQIDRSTTFTGAITVQATDPNQFLAQMRKRERSRALTQPALGGRRV